MRALCIFSGGLDSMLAAKVVASQGVEVLPVFFDTPFFESSKAMDSARDLNLPLNRIDITQRHIEAVKTPRFGYGSGMNPCIDCHALMARVAGELLTSQHADFVITGEVLGQRPMSQNRRSMKLVASESGIDGLLVRPLSAKNLPPTIPEKRGWLDRDKLLAFQGRSRKPQIRAAEKFLITRYPAPGGGCLLTEKRFSRRLKDLLNATSDPTRKELEMLKLGRHFRLASGARLVVGRNKGENEVLTSLASFDAWVLAAAEIPGPVAVLSGTAGRAEMETALAVTLAYSDSQNFKKYPVTILHRGIKTTVITHASDKRIFSSLLI
jgi:tRNA-uridine 2-sulfurtransferase